MMNVVTKVVDIADRFQQRWPWLAFPVAVFKKFGDDQAGNLAALIAYYGFVATFPLLLLFVTVLDITLRNDPQLQNTLINSALAHYPVIGDMIRQNLPAHGYPASGLPFVIGIVILVLGARGVAGAMRNALCKIWDVPKARRPGFPLSLVYDIALVLTVGLGLVVTTTLSGMAAGAGHLLNDAVSQFLAIVVSLVLNVGVFWLAFRIAAAFQVAWRDLRIGAAAAAIVWQVLQVVGGYVVNHQLKHASSLYGVFGVVLGLLAWLYLQAEITLYAAEIDVVLVKRLWPRSLRGEDSQQQEGQDTTEGRQNDRRAA
jgi:YihY family inner membrane protein